MSTHCGVYLPVLQVLHQLRDCLKLRLLRFPNVIFCLQHLPDALLLFLSSLPFLGADKAQYNHISFTHGQQQDATLTQHGKPRKCDIISKTHTLSYMCVRVG